MSTKERKRRGKQHTLRIQMLRKEGKITNMEVIHSLDANAQKRRKGDKGKEEKRKAEQAPDINVERGMSINHRSARALLFGKVRK
jgi:hypothetical protein